MGHNPYQPPAEALHLESDPLQFPAVGCMVLAMLAVVTGLRLLIISLLWFWLSLKTGRLQRQTLETLLAALSLFAFAGLAMVVSKSLRQRRKKWLIVAASIVGTAACIPAPVTLLILMRICRKDVWRSFDSAANISVEDQKKETL